MSKTEQKNQGFCQYCGQAAIIETVGEVSQAELDSMATDKCNCKEAQTERRKRERREKINKYVDKKFPECLRQFVHDAITFVENYDADKITINFDSQTCTIYMDSDSWLHIKIQRREDDELKV
jgi:hypothetical protein